LMGVFGPVIEALVLTMLDPGHDLPLGSGVASQLVGDKHTRGSTLLLEELAEQAFGGLLVAPALDENIENEAAASTFRLLRARARERGRRESASTAGPGSVALDSPVEGDGFETSVPREGPTRRDGFIRLSQRRLGSAPSEVGDLNRAIWAAILRRDHNLRDDIDRLGWGQRQAQNGGSPDGGPMVRIRLPPARSHVRT
jgi:hypothetical protein